MNSPDFIKIERGSSPLIFSVPHAGTDIPGDFSAGLVSPDLALRDTDWHVDKIYCFVRDMDATLLRTTVSRAVIDVNREPSGQSLYPQQATTGLVSDITFDGEPIYLEGEVPDADEVSRRKHTYYDPYHAVLQDEIDRLRALHSHVVLYDCHSIRSLVPRLFDGQLPIFNIGTYNGASCDPSLAEAVVQVCAQTGQSLVLNGRFVGGWITRHHGNPAGGVHAIQMELAQRLYMNEDDPETLPREKSSAAMEKLKEVAEAIFSWVRAFSD